VHSSFDNDKLGQDVTMQLVVISLSAITAEHQVSCCSHAVAPLSLHLLQCSENFETDVTPAILSRDFAAQPYRATKLHYPTVHATHCNFVE